MAQPWFRLYYEALDDPKIGRLTDSQFRVWVSVLMVQCAAGTDDGWTGLTVTGVGWRMRRECEADLRALESAGLVGIDEDGIVFVPAWSTRQFKSDNSTERVKRYRERQKQLRASLQKQIETVSSNGTKLLGETPPETDTETEQNREDISVQPQAVAPSPTGVPFPEFWAIWLHNRKGKADALKAWAVLKPDRVLFDRIKLDLSDRMARDPTWAKGMVMLPATYIRGRRWEDELVSGSSAMQDDIFRGCE